MPSVAQVPPQPLQAPLTDNCLISLRELSQRKQAFYRRQQERFAKVSDLLTNVAGTVNDRSHEEQTKHERKIARLQKDDDEEDEEELRQYQEFQTKVENLTKSMDQSIRSVIDHRLWLEGLPEVIKDIGVKSAVASQATQKSTQAMAADEMDVDTGDTAATTAGPPNPSETPTALLQAALSTQASKWQAKSMTERYAHDNDYIGFYRTVYDARHPGDQAPPCPPASIWFAEEESRITTAAGPGGSGSETDEDSDLEVAAETVSIRCPLTLLPFTDPVISMTCRHSYERSAILDMLKRSPDHVPWSEEQLAELNRLKKDARQRRERQLRVPQIMCPECRAVVTEADLRPNPILLRKVKRVLEARRREENVNNTSDLDGDEEDDERDAPRRGTQRKPYGLGSSPMARSSARPNVKAEKALSVVPQTQLSGGSISTQDRRPTRGYAIHNLPDDDDDENDDDEDDEMAEE